MMRHFALVGRPAKGQTDFDDMTLVYGWRDVSTRKNRCDPEEVLVDTTLAS